MSRDISSLTKDMFYISYFTGLQTSEILNLTTFEFNIYARELNDIRKKESEEKSSIIEAFYKLIARKGGL